MNNKPVTIIHAQVVEPSAEHEPNQAIAGLQHALDKIDELEAKVKELERRLVRLEVRA